MSEKYFSQPFYGSKYRGIVISLCLTTSWKEGVWYSYQNA